MSHIPQIHWHEGLFLQPHHFQHMQRQVQEQFAEERRLARPYAYGVAEFQLSPSSLENLLVEFQRLTAVMPSGLVVDVPGNADLSAANIEEHFKASAAPITLWLGVPTWHANQGNVLETAEGAFAQERRLYRVKEVERCDENTGENALVLPTRRINARLLTEGEDRTNLETMPLLRVGRGSLDEQGGAPRLDASFIPPCLKVTGFGGLVNLSRETIGVVVGARQELAALASAGGLKSESLVGGQLDQLLRLMCVSRAAARLESLMQAPALSPFDLYLELKGALAELGVLRAEREGAQAQPYDHNNLALVFQDLREKLETALTGISKQPYTEIKFAREDRCFAAEVQSQQLSEASAVFLGIRTQTDPKTLTQLVEDVDRFKLMCKSMAYSLVRGIPLQEEKFPPPGLPTKVGLCYYRLLPDQNRSMWERISEEQEMALAWRGGETSDFELSLFLTGVS